MTPPWLIMGFDILIALIVLMWGMEALQWIWHGSKIHFLKSVSSSNNNPNDSVSIIFSARNEEKKIGEAVFSMLQQNYANFNVVAVNDGSVDRTGAILHTFKISHPSLEVISIEDVPKKWVAKSYALWTGAKESHAEWLLFTDADVKFHPLVLKEALSFAQSKNLDHLIVVPDVELHGIFERLLYTAFFFAMGWVARPWKFRNPNSKQSGGIGAFNLVRRKTYNEIGTHEEFAMALVDDIELGRLIKKKGFRQDVLLGQDRVKIRWQESFLDMMKGLEKNAFAALGFNVGLMMLAVGSLLVLALLPWGALLSVRPSMVWMGGMAIVFQSVWFISTKRFHRSNALLVLFFPLGILFLAGSLCWSCFSVIKRKGVLWRGTFYSLNTLKRHGAKALWP